MKFNPLLSAMSVALAAIAAPAAQLDLTVQPPPGTTALADIGLYRVGWQSYGAQPLWMPVSWSGHFEAATGISFAKWGKVIDREAMLLHSPWHVPPGKTWVDYQLALPASQSARLSFGITMSPDSMIPDRSDGATFSVYLIGSTETGAGTELLREHYARAQWEDHAFDLSKYAGKTITLRLQVEPGPQNNASFDYSFFGNAAITIGSETNASAQSLDALMSTRAYKALESASRLAAANFPINGVIPSNLLPATNTLQAAGDSWKFTYVGNDCTVVYRYTPETGTLGDFTVQVDDGHIFQPAGAGIATAAIDGKEVQLTGGAPLKTEVRDGSLHVLWQYTAAGKPITIDWTYQIIGKAIKVTARCDSPVITRFSLGSPLAAIRRNVFIPYLLGDAHYLPSENLYACRYLDWTQSQSSSCPQGEATYEPKTDGSRNTLFETGYFAVSPDISEVLPNIPHSPSPFLSTLGDKIMLDMWDHHPGYASDTAVIRQIKDQGVDHVAIIQHVWQRYGYDAKLPDHFPANPEFGPESDLIEFGKAATDAGYLWSLHENYIDLYPDAPSYDPAARVLQFDGKPANAWYNPGTKVQSFGLKCNRALGFAQMNSAEIHRRYGTTAAYLDVHTSVPPWHQLDHEANQPMAAMAKAKIQYDSQLFQYERDTHQGPLFGEGHFQLYWAGRCDGVEAQVDGGEDHRPLLDFDLLKLHPQMVNHGMGYYERWYRRGYNIEYGLDVGSVEQWDKYRAMELAYGHAGFIGNVLSHHTPSIIREHHLVHPVQKLYGTARPDTIRYEVNGKLTTASVALAVGDTSRQFIHYNSGLSLWVNWNPQPWTVTPPGQAAHTLPQWGFLASGPGTLALTALKNGKVGDYVECPDYLFADARTHLDFPYRRNPIDIEPSLREFSYSGGDKIQVTYQWVVKEPVTANYHCFVHGLSSVDEPESDAIIFQGDHGFSRPTSQWKPGDVIIDGPHEIKVSPAKSQYDLVTGLYEKERVGLKGFAVGNGRILLAHLAVSQNNGQITNISAVIYTNGASQPRPFLIDRADFSAHVNPAGTLLDFGKIATDGSVKINREANRLVLFPYPRDCEFTVALDIRALAPTADADKIRVHALAAQTQADLGLVPFTRDGDRLVFKTGLKNAGRYTITW
jgi:hypothetical protein